MGLVWLVVLVNCAGRQVLSIYALAGDTTILGGRAYDDLKIVRTRAAEYYHRADNAGHLRAAPDHAWSGRPVQYSTAARWK